MNGIEKCEMFRAMRKRLCEDNGIPFLEEECPTPNENCIGTCTNCDHWLQRMRTNLNKKQLQGETIDFSGIRDIYNSYREKGGDELIMELSSPYVGAVSPDSIIL
jgi:hypothetical protein